MYFRVHSLSQNIHSLHCLMNLHLLCCLDGFCQRRTDFPHPAIKTQTQTSITTFRYFFEVYLMIISTNSKRFLPLRETCCFEQYDRCFFWACCKQADLKDRFPADCFESLVLKREVNFQDNHNNPSAMCNLNSSPFLQPSSCMGARCTNKRRRYSVSLPLRYSTVQDSSRRSSGVLT